MSFDPAFLGSSRLTWRSSGGTAGSSLFLNHRNRHRPHRVHSQGATGRRRRRGFPAIGSRTRQDGAVKANGLRRTRQPRPPRRRNGQCVAAVDRRSGERLDGSPGIRRLREAARLEPSQDLHPMVPAQCKPTGSCAASGSRRVERDPRCSSVVRAERTGVRPTSLSEDLVVVTCYRTCEQRVQVDSLVSP